MYLSPTLPIHLLILIISIPTLTILTKTLVELKYRGIMVITIISLILLTINIFMFSFTYIIDSFDGPITSTMLYNFWSTFIRTQALVTTLVLAMNFSKRFKKQ